MSVFHIVRHQNEKIHEKHPLLIHGKTFSETHFVLVFMNMLGTKTYGKTPYTEKKIYKNFSFSVFSATYVTKRKKKCIQITLWRERK